MTVVPTIKQGDLLPTFRAILRDPSGTPAPLASAIAVYFSMMSESTNETVLYREPATVVNTATGEVAYQWKVGETDVPGTYITEWVVIYPGPAPMTYPGDGFNSIVIAAGIPEPEVEA